MTTGIEIEMHFPLMEAIKQHRKHAPVTSIVYGIGKVVAIYENKRKIRVRHAGGKQQMYDFAGARHDGGRGPHYAELVYGHHTSQIQIAILLRQQAEELIKGTVDSLFSAITNHLQPQPQEPQQ